jgi:hypothetical protein
MRLRGTVKAAEGAATGAGLVAAYRRIRWEVVDALRGEFAEELDRLFPLELSTDGQPWGAQAQEVKTLMAQIAGWLDGVIEAAILDRRIEAEAEAKARQVGFHSPADQ